jgi:adenosylhomocysteine nucleosidase
MRHPGVVAALAAEARPLARAAQVQVTVAGVGAAAAEAGGRRLLNAGVGALVSWGVAAGLDPRLPPGALLLPTQVADGPRTWPVDAAWHRALQEALTCHTGTLVSAPSLLVGPADKQLLARGGALAADMESAALARLADQARVPFIIVRAVADPASMALPRAVAAALDGGRLRSGRLAAGLLAAPAQWGAVYRLARAFGCARRSLYLAAQVAGPRLGCPY